MAVKKFKNKAISKKRTKAVSGFDDLKTVFPFYFPEQNKTIYASSYKEALEKLKKI